MEAQLEHARKVIAADVDERDAFFCAALEPMIDSQTAAHLKRFEECRDAFIGKKKIYAHEAAFLAFPRLPAITFFDHDMFDDSIDHEARNGSDHGRSILRFDIWNPLLTEPEQVLVRALVEAANEYDGGGSSFGGL